MISTKYKLFSNQVKEQAVSLFLKKHGISTNLTSAKIFPNTLNLPSLPVPTLSQTIDKYIKSVTPFLSNDELSNTKKILQEFSLENGIGTKLQNILQQRASIQENWLEEWWLKTAYLGYRDPVVIFSTPGLVFPFESFDYEYERLEYTASLILGALKYKNSVYKDEIPVDKLGKEPLDMNQYRKIFGTCRIPKDKVDELSFHAESNHIVIVRNNNFFKLEVVNSNGEFASLNQVISQLEIIFKESEIIGPAVGILSSDNRYNWSKAYQELIQDDQNRRSVEEIQTSLFIVALDNPMPKLNDSRRSMASKQLIHGGGSRANSANRWFDKTIQFVVGQDGTVGLTYEHSPSEGQPVAVMSDYVIDYIKRNEAKALPDVKLEHYPKKLQFNINKSLDNYIHSASKNIDKLVNNLDMDSFQFSSFGKEFVKSQKLSPDSFIQIAIQYAFYRIHKVPGAHYESAATRKYIHGRTETIRSCSVESIAFAKTMMDKKKTSMDKVMALKAAIDSHKKYANDAVNGYGVDRHFLGLKLIALENDMDLPKIFRDPSYTRSTHMRLSTSQVATKCDGFMCYAPLTPDGYGCCYNPRPYDINFGISAFFEHPDTSARRFREALEESLKDMHDILAHNQKAKL